MIAWRVTQKEELSLPQRRHDSKPHIKFQTKQLRHPEDIPACHKDIEHVFKNENEIVINNRMLYYPESN